MPNIEQNWNEMAKAYEDFTENPQSYSYKMEWPYIEKMLPELKGKRILDLGGGTGRFALLLAKYQPASIEVVDISEEMLAIGRKKAADIQADIAFNKGDAADLKELPDGIFDFVFSSTTLHYLPDLFPVFSNIARLLKSGGRAVVSVMHPMYTAQYPIEKGDVFPADEDWQTRYLDKSKRAYIQPWIEYNSAIENYLSESYHHTTGDYINAIVSAGLKIMKAEEPLPPKEWKDAAPKRYESCIETPVFMIFSLCKKV